MTAPDAGAPEIDSDGGTTEDQKTFSQTELNSLLARQRREVESKFAGFDEIRDKAAKFDELSESTKSEIQRATEAAAEFQAQYEAAQAELDWRDTLLQRQRIAAVKGLDPKLWDRVKGETEEEITADIEDLMTLSPVVKPKASGLRSGATPPDITTRKEQAVAALRGIRETHR